MARPRQRPVVRTITPAGVAAGAELDITPDSSCGWLVRSIRAQLVTSAVVATRTVTLAVDDQNSQYYRAAAGATQLASLTRVYGGFAGSSGAVSGGPVIGLQLPSDGLWLPQGHHLRTVTDLLDPGDAWSGVALQVIEFPTGPNSPMWPFVATYTEEGD